MENTNKIGNRQTPETEIEKLKRLLEIHNVPQTYWGKVIDQDNRPLSGVKIQLAEIQSGVDLRREMAGTRSIPHEVVSDSSGNFELLNGTGISIRASPVTQGKNDKATRNSSPWNKALITFAA